MSRFLSSVLVLLALSGCGGGSDQAKDNEQELEKEIPVLNYGVSGNNSKDIVKRLSEIPVTTDSLSVVLVGTNDVLNWGGNTLPYDDYVANLNSIVDDLVAKSGEVILVKIPPVIDSYVSEHFDEDFFDKYGSPNGKVNFYNNAVESIALDNGLKVFDLNSLIYQESGVLPSKDSYIINEYNRNQKDGVHFVEVGYQRLAASIYDIVKSLPVKPKKIICVGDSLTVGYGAVTSYPKELSKLLNAKIG